MDFQTEVAGRHGADADGALVAFRHGRVVALRAQAVKVLRVVAVLGLAGVEEGQLSRAAGYEAEALEPFKSGDGAAAVVALQCGEVVVCRGGWCDELGVGSRQEIAG